AASLARDAAQLREPHQIPVVEEEFRKARLVDDVELLLQPGRHLGGDRAIFLPHRVMAQLVEEGVRRLPARDREAGETRTHQVETEAATLADLRRVCNAFIDHLPLVPTEDLANLGD